MYLDYAYCQLLRNMDSGSTRFARYKIEKDKKEKGHDNVQIESTNPQTTVSEIDYKAEFTKYVLKKGHTNPSTAALHCVREHMRSLYSTEQETFSHFQCYFNEYDTDFATRFQNMTNNNDDPDMKWMRDSLIPFGKELLNWCDGGDILEQSLYRCNGNFAVYDYKFEYII